MKAETKLTSKGQIVIPKAIREELRWRPGVRLAIEMVSSDAVRLELASNGAKGVGEDAIDQAFGFLADGDPLRELEAEHRKEVARDERRRRRR